MPGLRNDLGPSNLVLDKTKCGECLHYEVCYYRIEKKQPKMKEKRTEVFDNVVNIVECEFFSKKA